MNGNHKPLIIINKVAVFVFGKKKRKNCEKQTTREDQNAQKTDNFYAVKIL